MGRRSPSPRGSPPRALSEQDVDGLLIKLRTANGSILSGDELRMLAGIVETWAHLVELAASKQTGIHQIRRLLGIELRARNAPDASAEAEDSPAHAITSGDSAEPAEPGDAENEPASDPARKPKNRDPHGRRAASDFGKLKEVFHAHTTLHVGDGCPGCARGHVYKYRPSEFTTVSGQSPLVATRHTVDALQCNLCKAVFKAPLPVELVEDGIEELTLYSYSAVALVSVYRFFGGLPMHRQQTLQKALGVPVPDASIWDMCERMGNALRPIARALLCLAKDAPLFCGDDTGALVLDARTKVRPDRKTGVDKLRTGCHTTCVIGFTQQDRAITLFLTGIHHTGEVMDLVLAGREPSLAAPIFMGDCISSNTVTKTAVLYAGCNAHAVRRFKALRERYPEEADFVLERYGKIYEHDDYARAHNLSPEARRDHHRLCSRPLLREICEHGETLFEQRRVEPNSDLGQAFNFVLENERRLSAFARHPHAPLDNNRCERELRICVRLRETGRFFRNAIGASVADTVLTVGATALAANTNLVDYFVAVQRHAADVREHPDAWLPWNYVSRLQELSANRASSSAAPPDL